MDESNKHVSQERKDEITKKIMSLIDKSGDGRITREEWVEFLGSGGTLPDFGHGPGHHGDDEYEYEIHHWEK